MQKAHHAKSEQRPNIKLRCHTIMSSEKGMLPPDELVKDAYANGYKVIAITDRGNVRAFPDAYREWKRLWDEYRTECEKKRITAERKDFLKVIFGMEGMVRTEDGEHLSVLIYVKDQEGLINLYKLVTASHLRYSESDIPLIPGKLLQEHHDGLLICPADNVEDNNVSIPRVTFDDPRLIEEQTGYITPLREGKYLPSYPRAEEELTRICNEKVKELYGSEPALEITERLEQELDGICQNCHAGILLMWRELIKLSLDHGYPVSFRGGVGSSFVAYLCNITDINPLPARLGGMNIPAEVFLGVEFEKEPDIDIYFAPEVLEFVYSRIKELPGVGETCFCGVAQITSPTARSHGIKVRNGIHPGGIMVCPEGEELISFTPLTYHLETRKITTQFDYHAIWDNLLKMDALSSANCERLHVLQQHTGIRLEDIPMDDERTLSVICNGNVAEISALPEFGSEYVRRIIADACPWSFDGLVKINAIIHGTDIWYDNQDNLVRNGVMALSDCIASRDDIMLFLMERGMDRKMAYRIMEAVRKGKGISDDHENIMKAAGVPEQYMEICNKIRYLIPKAMAVANTMLAFRLAYYMVYYPEIYDKVLSNRNCSLG